MICARFSGNLSTFDSETGLWHGISFAKLTHFDFSTLHLILKPWIPKAISCKNTAVEVYCNMNAFVFVGSCVTDAKASSA